MHAVLIFITTCLVAASTPSSNTAHDSHLAQIDAATHLAKITSRRTGFDTSDQRVVIHAVVAPAFAIHAPPRAMSRQAHPNPSLTFTPLVLARSSRGPPDRLL